MDPVSVSSVDPHQKSKTAYIFNKFNNVMFEVRFWKNVDFRDWDALHGVLDEKEFFKLKSNFFLFIKPGTGLSRSSESVFDLFYFF